MQIFQVRKYTEKKFYPFKYKNDDDNNSGNSKNNNDGDNDIDRDRINYKKMINIQS